MSLASQKVKWARKRDMAMGGLPKVSSFSPSISSALYHDSNEKPNSISNSKFFARNLVTFCVPCALRWWSVLLKLDFLVREMFDNKGKKHPCRDEAKSESSSILAFDFPFPNNFQFFRTARWLFTRFGMSCGFAARTSFSRRKYSAAMNIESQSDTSFNKSFLFQWLASEEPHIKAER